jgi:hypothetical protein
MDEDTGKAATADEADDLIFVVVAKMDDGLSRGHAVGWVDVGFVYSM